MVIDRKLLVKVILFVEPMVQQVLNTRGIALPKWVGIAIFIPNNHPLQGYYSFIISADGNNLAGEWDPQWGTAADLEEMSRITLRELQEIRNGTLGEIIATRPWLSNRQHLKNWTGGTARDGIGVAVSGAIGPACDFLSKVILEAIIMFACMEAEAGLKTEREREPEPEQVQIVGT